MQSELSDVQFQQVRSLALRFIEDEDEQRTREDVIKFLDTLDRSQLLHPAISSLCIQFGLLPYIKRECVGALSERDILRYEYHKPGYINDGFVFHSAQVDVYNRLMDGKNVVLSAPTSFGKTKILDRILLSLKWSKIVIIVPTLALMDEIRRRLSQLKLPHQLLTHSEEPLSDQYIYVLTQERFIALDNLEVDFFFIDEFYLLDETREKDDSRLVALNIAWKRLYRTGAQYFLCAPTVAGVSRKLPYEVRDCFYYSDFSPVALEIDDRSYLKSHQRIHDLRELLKQINDEQKLIYVRSPKSARELAKNLITQDSYESGSDLTNLFADWIEQNYHPDWILVKVLRAGIGFHMGTLPSSLNRVMLKLFSLGEINTLICTSTLIRGVNTAAKNVIIYDNKIGTKRLDNFEYKNLIGRSGRMMEHFVGRIITYMEEPKGNRFEVDFPIETATQEANPEMWMRAEVESGKSALIFHQSDLIISEKTYKLNYNISLEVQESVAREFCEQPNRIESLRFDGTIPPKNAQIEMVKALKKLGMPLGGSEKSFWPKIKTNLFENLAMYKIFETQKPFENNDLDKAIEATFQFRRNILGFALPTYLRALERIINDVAETLGVASISFGAFIVVVEALGKNPVIMLLEEIGMPEFITEKILKNGFKPAETPSETIKKLKCFLKDEKNLRTLSKFERWVVKDVIEGI